jgi:hypothetical protein
MKVQNLCILGICLFFSCNMFGQDPDDKSIIGIWVSETDNTSKLAFTSDGKCQQYSENNLIATDSYILSNTTPQCGENVVVDDKSLFLSLKDIATGDEFCYYVNGITDKYLSLNYFDRGGVMVYLRSQTGSVTMQSGFNNVGSVISNEGLDVSLKLLFSPTLIMSIGNNYLVGNISQNMRPEVAHTLSLSINSQMWAVTINPDGNIYCKIVSGNAQPAKQTVLQILNYPLYDPANQ